MGNFIYTFLCIFICNFYISLITLASYKMVIHQLIQWPRGRFTGGNDTLAFLVVYGRIHRICVLPTDDHENKWIWRSPAKPWMGECVCVWANELQLKWLT